MNKKHEDKKQVKINHKVARSINHKAEWKKRRVRRLVSTINYQGVKGFYCRQTSPWVLM